MALHCSDITNRGGLESYERGLKFLEAIKADLKLAIAGNHDLSLDGKYWAMKCKRWNDPEEHTRAMENMRGQATKDAGVTYLMEGMHEFKLKNGAVLRAYPSPYQPKFSEWAFQYEQNEGHFNGPEQVAEGVRSVAE